MAAVHTCMRDSMLPHLPGLRDAHGRRVLVVELKQCAACPLLHFVGPLFIRETLRRHASMMACLPEKHCQSNGDCMLYLPEIDALVFHAELGHDAEHGALDAGQIIIEGLLC